MKNKKLDKKELFHLGVLEVKELLEVNYIILFYHLRLLYYSLRSGHILSSEIANINLYRNLQELVNNYYSQFNELPDFEYTLSKLEVYLNGKK